MHWSFGLLLAYIPFIGMHQQLDVYQTAWLGLLVAATFVCVVLHEFGHALSARRYGIPTQDIILLPIGGVARLMKIPEKPFHEFVIAIAGPLVNVAIALLLSLWFFYPGLSSLPSPDEGNELSLIGDYHFFIPALIFINVMLVVFNLLPAFPMDGGRVFRAMLTGKLGLYRATRIATFLGQILAVLMFVYGIWQFSFTTSLIGIFIFYAAYRENGYVHTKTLLSRHKVGDLAKNDFTRLQTGDTMQKAFDLLLKNTERHFLVFTDQQALAGTLPEWAVLSAVKDNALEDPILKHVEYGRTTGLSKSDSLKDAYETMRQSGRYILPVIEEDEVAGVVDREMLEKFLQGNRSLKKRRLGFSLKKNLEAGK